MLLSIASTVCRRIRHLTVWPVLPLLMSAAHPLTPPPASGEWPPSGPAWETDPALAFARAREEKKVVMAYVGSEGCPHCVHLAREVWADESVMEASQDMVCLAVHIHEQSNWAKRLNVIGYPQLRFLDGWGRRLEAPEPNRTPESFSAAIRSMKGRTRWKAPRRRLPSSLKRLIPREVVPEAVGPDPLRRVKQWLTILEGEDWPAEDLLALFEWEEDPLVRLQVLKKVDALLMDKAAYVQILRAGMSSRNDYVLQASLEGMLRVRDTSLSKDLLTILEAAHAGTRVFDNGNNVMIYITETVAELADPAFVPVLTKIIEHGNSQNSLVMCALDALIAIGNQHGLSGVRKGLQAALSVPGLPLQSARLREKAEEQLRRLERE